MLYSINRNVLILFPKQPIFDWANYIYPDDKIPCPEPLAHDQGDVFLIPEFTYPNDAMDYLKLNYLKFFKQELLDWTEDESLWPDELTWDLFESWFHYSIQSVVVDTLDEDITK